MSTGNVSGISGGVPIIPVGSAEANNAARLVAKYNEQIDSLFTFVGKWTGVSSDFINTLATVLGGIKTAINSKTPEQLAAIPGFIEGMRDLTNSLQPALQQCDSAMMRGDGVINWLEDPLLKRQAKVSGGEVVSFVPGTIHGMLVDAAVSVFNTLGL